MIQVMTPEQFLGLPSPKIAAHYGTCDYCKTRMVFVLHLNYNEQPNRDFRICEECAEEIIGWLTAFRLKKGD